MDATMNKLFRSFDQQSDIVQHCLTQILENVTEGKVPSADDVKTLDNSLKNLRMRYDVAYEAAKNAVLPEELPEHGSSIADIVTALENNENNRILKQLSDAKNILEKFISVRSLVEEYENAISSYQKEAKEILEQLNPNTIDDLYPKTEAPSLFLQVMDLAASDIHNSNGIALMKILKNFYPEDEIQYGLIGQKYFYDNGSSIEATVEDQQTNETEISGKSHQRNEKINKGSTKAEQKTEIKQKSETAQKSETTQKSEARQKTETAQKTESKPKTLTAQKSETKPKSGTVQKSEAKPKTETTQKTGTAHKSETKPKTGTTQKSESKPKTETAQKAESAQKTATTQKPEAKPKIKTELQTNAQQNAKGQPEVNEELKAKTEQETETESQSDVLQDTDLLLDTLNLHEEKTGESDQSLGTSVINEPDVDGEVFTATNQASIALPHPSDFKKELATMCMNHVEVASILSLFTHYGFMGKSQIFLFGRILDCFGDYNKDGDRVFDAVDLLVDKGYLACFTVLDAVQKDHEMSAYCLTKYCLSSMLSQGIESQIQSICGVDYGTVFLAADTTLNADLASHFYYSNYVLIDYLYAQTEYFDSEDYQMLAKSAEWIQDHYQAFTFSKDDLVESYVVSRYTDVESIKDSCLIISLTYNECPKHFNSACEIVFAVKNHQIYYCTPRFNILEQVRIYDMLDSGKTQDVIGLLNAMYKMSGQDEEDEDGDTDQLELEGEDGSNVSDDANDDVDTDTSNVEKKHEENTQEISSHQSAESINEGRETTEQENPIAAEDVKATADEKRTEVTAQTLLNSSIIPSDANFCKVINDLLHDKPEDERELTHGIVNAVLLAKGASLEVHCNDSKKLFTQLQLSTNILRNDCAYTSLNLSSAFDGTEADSPALVLTAYMQAMLTPADPRDYALRYKTEDYFNNYDTYFPELSSFKELFSMLLQIRDVSPAGFTSAVIVQLSDEDKQKQYIEELKAQAGKLLTYNRIDTRIKTLPQMYLNEFGSKSDLYYCMTLINNGAADQDSLDSIKSILEEFCDYDDGHNEYIINNDKIEEKLDAAWNAVNHKSSFKLEYTARPQAIKQYKARLEVMLAWVDAANAAEGSKAIIGRLGKIRDSILSQINLIKDDDSWKTAEDANILSWCLLYMSKYLNDEVSQLDIFDDVLRTGVISISENGTPVIDDSLAGIKYYEVWRNALRHITAERKDTSAIVSEILGETEDSENGLKDNLNQLSMLGKYLGSSDSIYSITNDQIEEAENYAKIKKEQFKDNLELAYTYCRINETEKETLLGILSQYESSFYESGDFACWRRFLEALEMQVQEFTANRKAALTKRLLKQIQKDGKSAILIEAEHALEVESNFAVAEEYLGRYEAGETKIDAVENKDIDYFSDFLSDEVFTPLYTACSRGKGTSFRTFALRYFEKNNPKRLSRENKRLITCWPIRKDKLESQNVKSLFECLGFSVRNAVKVDDTKEEQWQVYVNPARKGLTDYLHPIAAFGTQMKSPLNVIFLYGTHTGQEIVDLVTSMNLGGIAIVFLDSYVNSAERRHIGEVFHTQKSGQNPFLLIDQVLMMYLAMHQRTERLPAMLQCTLPYSTYQPFVRDAGFTADEMFFGRKKELHTIIDINGASVVYGGRQLGKTALLQRAESRCSNPEGKEYAVYTSIVGTTAEADVVEHLIYDIKRKTNDRIALKNCSNFKDMCNQLGEMFAHGEISSMHLFIDEVDDFLEAIADAAYKPIQPLVNLKRDTNNNFKFVIAGLHNVCRAKNATEGNGIFGQLGTPLCIKPLSPSESYQLLAKPLHYLGFKIDSSANLETILTNTNYYPGILQFFGYSLVETLTTHYSEYYSAIAGNPPFTLTDKQLGTIMSSADLNNSIKEKFKWSLELDNRYFMIARCITLLYHLYEDNTASGIWRGFPVEEIMEMANSFKIKCLDGVSRTEYITLLDEMTEMGILSRPEKDKNLYRLRKNSFLDIIGEDIETIEQDINDNNV